MTNGKDAESNLRKTRESKIFCDPPGSGNYSRVSVPHRALNCSGAIVECGAPTSAERIRL